jgi:hypothetical protein
VTAPAFFTSASKGNECWWGTQDSRVAYLWDSMDDKDRQDSLDTLRTQDRWIVWKTKDKVWTQKLQQEGFAQILTLDKDKIANGVPKSRDGGEEETSKLRNARKQWNAG